MGVAIATLLAAAGVAAPHAYHVTDLSQPDRPVYELTFRKPLRNGADYAGLAHDSYTDRDIRVRFRLTRCALISVLPGVNGVSLSASDFR